MEFIPAPTTLPHYGWTLADAALRYASRTGSVAQLPVQVGLKIDDNERGDMVMAFYDW